MMFRRPVGRSVSIIIPAYNEEKRLPATLERIIQYLDGGTWCFSEIIVVDDGSTDGTRTVVQGLQEKNPEVRLVSNDGNRGKGYSVRHGMLEARGEWALFSDADLSTPIEDLECLIRAAEENNVPVAFGSRALDPSLIGIHQSAFRESSGRLFNLIVRLVTGLPFRDTQCGFKLFETQAAREIFKRQRLERFGFDVEVLFIAKRLGFHAVEVPVHWNNSEATTVSLWSGLRAFCEVGQVRFNAWIGRYQ